MRIDIIRTELVDYQIGIINRFINGERVFKSHTTRREREDVSYSMIHLINDVCGIHSDGIPVGEIYPSRYKREKKRREKYWKKANAGKIIDSRRGYDKYRRR